MKKLLGIFTAFSITTSSSLSIVSCSNSDEQKAIDKAIVKLKDKTLTISVTKGDQDSVKEAIKNNSNFKTKLGDLDIKIESMEFTKGGTKFSTTFVDNTEYEVTIKIKKEGTNKEKSTEAKGEVNFKIKIKFLTDKEKVIAAKNKLDAIKPDKAIVEVDLTSIDASEVISKIKDAKFYKDIVKDKIELEGDLSLAKDDKKTAISNQELIDNATVFVSGKIKVKNEQADFKFSIKLKQKTTTAKDLSTLTNPTIKSLATADAFKTALITVLKTQLGFSALDSSKIEIKKTAGNIALVNGDITGSTIAVTISAKSGIKDFIGSKDLTVTWSAVHDLGNLTDPTIKSLATVVAFEAALIAKLKTTQSKFANLDASKVEIKKTAGKVALLDGDITGTSIAVTISAKSGIKDFIGSKDLTVTWSAVHDLGNLTDPTIQSLATVVAFEAALIAKLKTTQSKFANLDASKVEIKKTAGNIALRDEDITGTSIDVTISAKSGIKDFIGSKDLTVTWSAVHDLGNLTDPTIQSLATVVAFEAALIAKLKTTQSKFANLDASKVEIKKTAGNIALRDEDITGTSIDVTISAKSGITDFIGSKDLTVTWSV